LRCITSNLNKKRARDGIDNEIILKIIDVYNRHSSEVKNVLNELVDQHIR